MTSKQFQLTHYARFILIVIFALSLPQAACGAGNRSWVNSPCFVWEAFRVVVDPNDYLTTNESILVKGETLGQAIEACCDHPDQCTHQILSSVLDTSSEQAWEVQDLAHMWWCEYGETLDPVCSGDVCKVEFDENGDVAPFCECAGCPTTDYPTWSETFTTSTNAPSPQATSLNPFAVTTAAPDDGGQTQTYVIIGAVVGGLLLVIVTTTLAIIGVRRCKAKEETAEHEKPHQNDQPRHHRSDQRYDEENPRCNDTKHIKESGQISRGRSNPNYVPDSGFKDTTPETHLSLQSPRTKHSSGGKPPKVATQLSNGSQQNDLNNPKPKKKHRRKQRSPAPSEDNNVNYKAASEMYIHPPKETQYNEPFSPPIISDPKHYGNRNFSTVNFDNYSSGKPSDTRRKATDYRSNGGHMQPRPNVDGIIYETMNDETVAYDYIDADEAKESISGPAVPSRRN